MDVSSIIKLYISYGQLSVKDCKYKQITFRLIDLFMHVLLLG